MEKMALFSVLIILACVHVKTVRSALGYTELNCVNGASATLQTVNEGYEGEIEIITNIGPYDRPVLQPQYSSNLLKMIELVYTEGDSTATVRTIKPLDAEEIRQGAEAVYYFIICPRGTRNHRTLWVRDLNEYPPVFQSKTYSATVSETTAVGSIVLTIPYSDKDATHDNRLAWYSILDPVPGDFEVDGVGGNIRLTNPLNYNNVQQYIFTVEVKDREGLNDRATVTITVKAAVKQNESFDQNKESVDIENLDEELIEDNQVGDFSDITPDDMKDQDDDTGINEPLNSPEFK